MVTSTGRRLAAVISSFALALAALTLLPATNAAADTAPINPSDPTTVSSDPLPTVQIDGVVWAQRVVGNTVFVGGQFTTARPAGAAPGVNTTPRANFLAYDIRTGELITSINHSFNSQVLAVAVSPDQKRVYLGGDFTTVDGVKHERVVALDAATGAVVNTWKGGTWAKVAAIAATNDTVYVGGKFSAAGSGAARSSLAAFSATDGTLLNWAPVIGGTAARINSMTMNPSQDKVIVGGSFATLNGVAATGVGALDPVTGTTQPYPISTIVKNSGASAAILSLEADATSVYGSGYTYGPGNLEGTFKVDGETGTVQWIEDCHGDTYSIFPMNSEIYAVGHQHYCGNIGGYPQTSPTWTFHRALAFSKAATGVITKDPYGYYNWEGNPSPTPLYWYPELEAGTFTGVTQAAWSVSGNSQYLVAGGEFPSVNGKAQQGLVRFPVKSIAPNKEGPYNDFQKFVPALSELPNGGVKGTFAGNWDTDNELLNYKVTRQGSADPIKTISNVRSTFWKEPTIIFVDPNVQAGQTYQYRLEATDPFGNVTKGDWTTFTPTKNGGQASAYANSVFDSYPSLYWRQGETSGTALDWAGTANGVRGTGVTGGQAGALTGDTDPASSFNGATTARVATPQIGPGPQEFTVEAWVKTNTTRGGKIIGFGSSQSGSSSSYDRHLYMRNDGKVTFGVYNNAVSTLTSPNALNDNNWHQVVGTLSRTDGMRLYVDGVLAGGDPNVKFAQSYNGYWRVGGDNLGSWTGQPTSNYFSGLIDETAVYPTPLSSAQVMSHWVASGRNDPTPNTPPNASYTFSSNKLDATFDASGSTDPDGTIASYAWDFGDGTTGNGANATHPYTANGTYNVKLTVTDNRGGTGTQTQAVTVFKPANVPPTADFTASTTDLTTTVDASASADADGSIASYAWDYGDGGTATGKTPVAHVYAAAGTYDVTLTVTDNEGATGAKTVQVTTTAPLNWAKDALERVLATGLGTADTGGAWTITGGASNTSVSNGSGKIKFAAAGSAVTGALNTVKQTNGETSVDLVLDKAQTGGGTYVKLSGRRIDASNGYTARLRYLADGTVSLSLMKSVAATDTVIKSVTLPGTYTPGSTMHLKFLANGAGATDLRTKAWIDGNTEPDWQVTATDSEATLQVPGGIAIGGNLSASSTNAPMTLTFDNLITKKV